jgi:hypothetical protein
MKLEFKKFKKERNSSFLPEQNHEFSRPEVIQKEEFNKQWNVDKTEKERQHINSQIQSV